MSDARAPSPARSASFENTAIAEAYARHLVPSVFAPWAADLVARAGLAPGQAVADVATGPGTVAREAALAVTPGGRVVGYDPSEAMLAVARVTPSATGAVPVEFRRSSADCLDATDGEFDALVCQQGVQFFPDRAAALAELHRVLRPGGTLAVSSWDAASPLGLFGPLAEALAGCGLTEPYPGAFEPWRFALSADELAGALGDAGFVDVGVVTMRREIVWPDAPAVVALIAGTPFGPVVGALAPEEGAEVERAFVARLGPDAAGLIHVTTVANVARARA